MSRNRLQFSFVFLWSDFLQLLGKLPAICCMVAFSGALFSVSSAARSFVRPETCRRSQPKIFCSVPSSFSSVLFSTFLCVTQLREPSTPLHTGMCQLLLGLFFSRRRPSGSVAVAPCGGFCRLDFLTADSSVFSGSEKFMFATPGVRWVARRGALRFVCYFQCRVFEEGLANFDLEKFA